MLAQVTRGRLLLVRRLAFPGFISQQRIKSLKQFRVSPFSFTASRVSPCRLASLIIGASHQGESGFSHVWQCPAVYSQQFQMVSGLSCHPSHLIHVSRTLTVGQQMCRHCACRHHVPTEVKRILWIRGVRLCTAAASSVLQADSLAFSVGVFCGDGVSGSDISSSLVVPISVCGTLEPPIHLHRWSSRCCTSNTSRLTIPGWAST